MAAFLAPEPRGEVRFYPILSYVPMVNRASFAGTRGPALLFLASSVLLFFDFGSRIFATNDETRFPLLARDILAQGNWFLPHLNGSPYLHKPPLYAWLIAVAAWPAGSVTQRTAALPSLLAALAVVLGTYWIAQRLFGAGVGILAGLILVTTFGMFTLARVPMPDMTLCAAITAAMAAYTAFEFDGRQGALVAFYTLVGVAFWAKGPAGLLPLAVAGADTLATHGRAGLARLASAPGLLLLLPLLVPWPVLAAATGREEFVREVVRNDGVLWYFPTRGWSWRLITEPASQALTSLLPWSLLVPAVLWSAARPADREHARRRRLLLLWAGTVFVLTAISQHQRMRYYLPLGPPAALLIAVWYSGLNLHRRLALFASLWMAVAVGLSLWQVDAGARHNAMTRLRSIVHEVRRAPAPVYAVEVPALVFAFHLERPVIPLSSYRDFEQRIRAGREGYLIIGDRATPPPVTLPVRHAATGFLNGRQVLLLAHDPTSLAR